MKMELIEGSETSAISIVTPGNYPKENILHTEHGESLKSRSLYNCSKWLLYWPHCHVTMFSCNSHVACCRKNGFERRKADRIGHIVRRNCLRKHVSKVKTEGRVEVTGRRSRRRKSCQTTKLCAVNTIRAPKNNQIFIKCQCITVDGS